MTRLNLLNSKKSLHIEPYYVVHCEDAKYYKRRYIYNGKGVDLTLFFDIDSLLAKRFLGKEPEYIE